MMLPRETFAPVISQTLDITTSGKRVAQGAVPPRPGQENLEQAWQREVKRISSEVTHFSAAAI
jgi:hypothetical protein